jgi:hypothetical protein
VHFAQQRVHAFSNGTTWFMRFLTTSYSWQLLVVSLSCWLISLKAFGFPLNDKMPTIHREIKFLCPRNPQTSLSLKRTPRWHHLKSWRFWSKNGYSCQLKLQYSTFKWRLNPRPRLLSNAGYFNLDDIWSQDDSLLKTNFDRWIHLIRFLLPVKANWCNPFWQDRTGLEGALGRSQVSGCCLLISPIRCTELCGSYKHYG